MTQRSLLSAAVKPESCRDEGLIGEAIDAFQAGSVGDGLLIAESVCRNRPSDATPAILRAKIIETCLPALAARAWYCAWQIAPEDEHLQDAVLSIWLKHGAHDSLASLGSVFLQQRCRRGSHASLLDLLKHVSMDTVGACWKSGSRIEGVVFHLPSVGGANAAPILSLCASNGHSSITVPVSADGTPFCITPPSDSGVWSVYVEMTSKAGPVRCVLQGSPLTFSAIIPCGRTLSPPSRRAEYVRLPTRFTVDIIIPVYRDETVSRACIESVIASLASNKTRARIVVIEDQSPEPLLCAWLSQLADEGSIVLLRNPVNLGFIESANRGIHLSKVSDVLLLNADTLVHGDWIDRLCVALYRESDLACVMPWSNNAELGSFPKINTAAPIPSAPQLAIIDQTAAALHAAGHLTDADVPSVCGFAMLMRRDVIREIGALDGVALTRGYLEEVDWCLRARQSGYRHALATGVFVAHAGGKSFRAEKVLRVRQNRRIIAARYPDYYREYHRFIRSDPLSNIRETLVRALQKCRSTWITMATAHSRPSAIRSIPEPLPCAYVRIGVWHHRLAAPHAAQVLRLARAIATEHASEIRLLIFGEVSEALRHTGVVEHLPFTGPAALTPLSDSAMIGLTNCIVLLSEDPPSASCQIPIVAIDQQFDALAWLKRWHPHAMSARNLDHANSR